MFHLLFIQIMHFPKYSEKTSKQCELLCWKLEMFNQEIFSPESLDRLSQQLYLLTILFSTHQYFKITEIDDDEKSILYTFINDNRDIM